MKSGDESLIGTAVVLSAFDAAKSLGLEARLTTAYFGDCDWLCLWGVGHEIRSKARDKHVAKGGHVACWDLGYLGGGKEPGVSYQRVSVDYNHPWRDLDRTPSDSTRFDRFQIKLRNDSDPDGPVIVIGMGPKARKHLGLSKWEMEMLQKTQARFPKRKVLYRPKPILKKGVPINRDHHIKWETTKLDKFSDVLRGASLVITRHSNCAVEACIAGVPVECDDGAAYWLYRHGSQQSEGARLDFLRRLAWWQYRTDEMREAWTFLQMICA